MANVSSNNNALVVTPPLPGATNTAVAQDIRDIKEPLPISSYWGWLILLAALLAIAVLVYFLKKRKKAPTIDPQLLIPPHRRAKEKLRGATELISDPYRFCSLVSDVIRVYLEERFNLHAPDRTTDEFLAELRDRSSLSDEHKLLLEDFLTRCDLVKFARHEPTEPELRALLDAALRLIDETQEVETPPAVPQAAEAAKS
jgi:hypothetical protein